jgi:hypothetical protein
MDIAATTARCVQKLFSQQRQLPPAAVQANLGSELYAEAWRQRWLAVGEDQASLVLPQGEALQRLLGEAAISKAKSRNFAASAVGPANQWALKYFKGVEDLEANEFGTREVYVFEFLNSDADHSRFINEVGGEPDPRGGQSIVLATSLKDAIPKATLGGLKVEDASGDADVGDEVVVADAGKTYKAAVASKNPDGTYKLSFGSGPDGKPPRDAFKKSEVKVTKRATPAAGSATFSAPNKLTSVTASHLYPTSGIGNSN